MEFITRSAVARRLGVSGERVTQLAAKGEIPVAMTTPLGALYDPVEVEKVAKRRAEQAKTNRRIKAPS